MLGAPNHESWPKPHKLEINVDYQDNCPTLLVILQMDLGLFSWQYLKNHGTITKFLNKLRVHCSGPTDARCGIITILTAPPQHLDRGWPRRPIKYLGGEG